MFKLVATLYESGDMVMSFVELTNVSQDKHMDMDLNLTIFSPLQSITCNMQILLVKNAIKHSMVTVVTLTLGL
jgi:hypothetical protein